MKHASLKCVFVLSKSISFAIKHALLRFIDYYPDNKVENEKYVGSHFKFTALWSYSFNIQVHYVILIDLS